MTRPAVLSVEDKSRLVITVVSGEMTYAEAARRPGIRAADSIEAGGGS